MPDRIHAVALWIALEIPLDEICRTLTEDDGMTAYEAFLTYKAAEILHNDTA